MAAPTSSLLALLSVLLPTALAASTAKFARTGNAGAPWKQPKIALSFWVDPMVPVAEFPERYAEIAEANFTVVLGGFGATTPEVGAGIHWLSATGDVWLPVCWIAF